MCAMRSKRFNGVHVVVGVASRVIWQHFSVLGQCGNIKMFSRAFESQDVTRQRCWSKDKLQRNPRRWDISRKVSMLFLLVFEWRLQVMWNHYEVWTSEEWLRIKCPCGDRIFSFELTGVQCGS